MTPEVYAYVKKLVDEGKLDSGRILDIGARDVNGCVRDLFPGREYYGLDKEPGRNVDFIMNVRKLQGHWDHILCLEMLEHDPEPHVVLWKIRKHIKPGGRMVVTTRGPLYPLHDEPEDYYRFTEHGLGFLLRFFDDVDVRPAEKGRAVFGTAVAPHSTHGVYRT